MNKGRTGRSINNMVVAMINKILMMFLPFLARTVMIQKMGVEYLGLNSLFTSILSVLSLSELGFSSAIVYSMYKPIAEDDYKTVGMLLKFYKNVYRIIGCIIMGLGLIILPYIENFIASDYPDGINIYMVYLIFLFNTGVSYFLYAYKNSVLIAAMRDDLSSFFDMLRSVVMNLLQVTVLLIFCDYYIYALIMPLTTICNNIVTSMVVDKKYPEFKCNDNLPKESRREIMSRVSALIGHKLGGTVFTSVDSAVISAFIGLEVLGKYSNYYLIFTSVFALVSTVMSSIQSVIGNSLVCKSESENYDIFNELQYVNSWCTCVCSCCLVCLYQPFMRLWVGSTNMLDDMIPVLLATYFWIKSSRRVTYTYKEAAGLWREDMLKPYISVLVNLSANIILVKLIGLPGVIISSIIAIALIEIPWENKILFAKCFRKSPLVYYIKTFGLLVATMAISIITMNICNLLGDGIKGFIAKCLISVCLSSCLFLVCTYKNKNCLRILNRIKAFVSK